MFVCKVRMRTTPREFVGRGSASECQRHAADSSRTRGAGSSAHREGEGYRPEHIKRVDELLVCAAVACRADELGGVPRPFALGRWARTYRPKQVTDWVARLEKLEQTLPAESGSQQLARAASLDREECAGQTFAPPIHWSGKYRPASVRFSAYSRGRPRLGWRERSSRG